jgi:hypothetical protein
MNLNGAQRAQTYLHSVNQSINQYVTSGTGTPRGTRSNVTKKIFLSSADCQVLSRRNFGLGLGAGLPILPDFPKTLAALRPLESSVPVSSDVRLRGVSFPGFSLESRNTILITRSKHFDFPTLGWNLSM